MDQRITGPAFVAGRGWVVQAIDSVVEDVLAEKVFPSAEQANRWIAEVQTGQSAIDPLAVSGVKAHRAGQIVGIEAIPSRDPSLTATALNNQRAAGRFALRPVAQVLTEAGLDPFVEIARVLQEQTPVTDRSGNAVLDETGEPLMADQVAGFDRAKVLLELAQYMTPKLKAVEMKVGDLRKTPLDVLDARIAALLSRQELPGKAGL